MKEQNYLIRKATIDDLEIISDLEALCFPKEEAASRAAFEQRLKTYSDCFWLLIMDGKLVSMINGMVANTDVLTDEMYSNSSLHNNDGDWQMIFGVGTRPEYRRKGLADLLMKNVIAETKAKNRKGLVLTCKKELLHYYKKFGFVNEGLSESEHGAASWYQMKLIFK